MVSASSITPVPFLCYPRANPNTDTIQCVRHRVIDTVWPDRNDRFLCFGWQINFTRQRANHRSTVTSDQTLSRPRVRLGSSPQGRSEMGPALDEYLRPWRRCHGVLGDEYTVQIAFLPRTLELPLTSSSVEGISTSRPLWAQSECRPFFSITTPSVLDWSGGCDRPRTFALPEVFLDVHLYEAAASPLGSIYYFSPHPKCQETMTEQREFEPSSLYSYLSCAFSPRCAAMCADGSSNIRLG